MFTSNPFPSFSTSSSYPPLPHETQNAFASDTFLHDPLAVLPFMPTQSPTPETVADSAAIAMLQKDAININSALYGNNFLTKKPAAKKDRHSKIHTSQGLRDRRVRLSSEIARKFFDLQDMLKYDKPSNTLEWLFTKSEDAIKELARSKHCCISGDANSSQLRGVDSNHKSLVGNGASKESKLKWVEKLEDVDVCVEAKKKAIRARARKRTSSSMMEERFPAAANPQIQLHQLMPSIQPHEACATARWPKLLHPHLLDSDTPRDGFDVIKESIVFKRNLLSSHHQNPGIPGEATFNYNNDCLKSPPNWDTNFCAMASMNLSTELQIFGKSWEECTNQRRH